MGNTSQQSGSAHSSTGPSNNTGSTNLSNNPAMFGQMFGQPGRQGFRGFQGVAPGHHPTPPRGPPTPQNYPQGMITTGQNGMAPQNVLIGSYVPAQGGGGHLYPQSFQPGSSQSNCGTPSIASLQMV